MIDTTIPNDQYGNESVLMCVGESKQANELERTLSCARSNNDHARAQF